MDQELTYALIVLSGACLLLLVVVSFRAFWQGAGAGLVVFGVIYLAALLSDTSQLTSTKLGVAGAEIAFVFLCPILDRPFQEERARRYLKMKVEKERVMEKEKMEKEKMETAEMVEEAKRRAREPGYMEDYWRRD